jgi:hypothetical protein
VKVKGEGVALNFGFLKSIIIQLKLEGECDDKKRMAVQRDS